MIRLIIMYIPSHGCFRFVQNSRESACEIRTGRYKSYIIKICLEWRMATMEGIKNSAFENENGIVSIWWIYLDGEKKIEKCFTLQTVSNDDQDDNRGLTKLSITDVNIPRYSKAHKECLFSFLSINFRRVSSSTPHSHYMTIVQRKVLPQNIRNISNDWIFSCWMCSMDPILHTLHTITSIRVRYPALYEMIKHDNRKLSLCPVDKDPSFDSINIDESKPESNLVPRCRGSCGIQWCDGYGMLLILTTFTYVGLLYYQVIKPRYGRQIYEQSLKPLQSCLSGLFAKS